LLPIKKVATSTEKKYYKRRKSQARPSSFANDLRESTSIIPLTASTETPNKTNSFSISSLVILPSWHASKLIYIRKYITNIKIKDDIVQTEAYLVNNYTDLSK